MIKEALDHYAKSLEEGKPKRDDRAKTVGASEIGQCMRKIHWRKKGYAADSGFEQRYGAHVRGTLMEKSFWEPALRARFGGKLHYSGEYQRQFTVGNLSSTPDGLVTEVEAGALREYGVEDCSGSFLVECKTVDPRTHMNAAREDNVFQVQVQLGTVREASDHKPEYALVTYLDASFWDEVTVYVVKFDPKVYEVAKARATMVLTAKSGADLPPEGYIAGGKECEYCPYQKPCGVAQQPPGGQAQADLDPQLVAELVDLCKQIVWARQTSADWEKQARSFQEEVKARLREKGLSRVPGVVYWSSVKGRESLDIPAIKALLKELRVDIENYSTVGQPTDRLSIDKSIEGSVSED